jgi:septal ring factor EnvC (AmiA/AmiB activator)
VAKSEHLPDESFGGQPFAALRGRLRLPVRGELMNRFGAPRHDGGTVWKGLFIRSAHGAEVRAVATGRIVFADWLRGFGNLIILDHGNSYLSVYGNNESLYKAVGHVAQAGEAIASVGNSGGNADSGLYFELRHQGRPLDPTQWINFK